MNLTTTRVKKPMVNRNGNESNGIIAVRRGAGSGVISYAGYSESGCSCYCYLRKHHRYVQTGSTSKGTDSSSPAQYHRPFAYNNSASCHCRLFPFRPFQIVAADFADLVRYMWTHDPKFGAVHDVTCDAVCSFWGEPSRPLPVH